MHPDQVYMHMEHISGLNIYNLICYIYVQTICIPYSRPFIASGYKMAIVTVREIAKNPKDNWAGSQYGRQHSYVLCFSYAVSCIHQAFGVCKYLRLIRRHVAAIIVTKCGW